jgi:hypothetical protein
MNAKQNMSSVEMLEIITYHVKAVKFVTKIAVALAQRVLLTETVNVSIHVLLESDLAKMAQSLVFQNFHISKNSHQLTHYAHRVAGFKVTLKHAPKLMPFLKVNITTIV